MGIIELPAWRLRSLPSDRVALRAGMAVSRPVMRVMKPLDGVAVKASFCDRCASPIEFGAVMNGYGTYCSVECSLEGPTRSA
jgi:hypothetical protein